MSVILYCSRPMRLLACTARWFCTSPACQSKQAVQRRWQRMTERYLKRTADALSGIANRSQKSKRGTLYHAMLPVNARVSSSASAIPNAGCQRRARQLSSVFYDYITSLLSCGEICPELNELGFEVVQVKVVSDLSVINVLWAASGGPVDDEVAALLPRCAAELKINTCGFTCAGRLLSALMDLRIMGNIPPIQFVKDLTAARLHEVEELLKKADMGPDHIPSELGDCLKTEPVLVAEGKSWADKVALRNVPVTSRQLEGMLFKPGPGGSFEVSAAHEGQQLGGTIETENHNARADTKVVGGESRPQDVQPIFDSNADPGRIRDSAHAFSASQHFSNDYRCAVSRAPAPCRGNDVRSAESNSSSDDASRATTRFRSDIYGLDYGALYQQVLNTKRRAEDRSYVRQQQSGSRDGIRDSAGVRLADAEVDGFVTDKRKNVKRSSRELNRLLSSQFHQNSGD